MKKEIEIDEVEKRPSTNDQGGLTKGKGRRNKKVFKVEFFDNTREVGGIVLGRRYYDGGYKITRLIQFNNRSKEPDIAYGLPNAFIIFFRIWLYLWRGWFPIGEWHSHLDGQIYISRSDSLSINKRLEQVDMWIVVIVTKDTARKSRVLLFNRDEKTNQSAKVPFITKQVKNGRIRSDMR